MAAPRVSCGRSSFARWNGRTCILRGLASVAIDDYDVAEVRGGVRSSSAVESSQQRLDSVSAVAFVCTLNTTDVDSYVICGTTASSDNQLQLITESAAVRLVSLPSAPSCLAAVQHAEGVTIAWTTHTIPDQIQVWHGEVMVASSSVLHSPIASLHTLQLPSASAFLLFALLQDNSLCGWWLRPDRLDACMSSGGPLTHSPCCVFTVASSRSCEHESHTCDVTCVLACADGTILAFDLDVKADIVSMSPIRSTRIHAHAVGDGMAVNVSPCAVTSTCPHDHVVMSNSHAWRVTGRTALLLGPLHALLDASPPLAAVFTFAPMQASNSQLQLVCANATNLSDCHVLRLRTDAATTISLVHDATGNAIASAVDPVEPELSEAYAVSCIASCEAAEDSAIARAEAASEALSGFMRARVEAVTGGKPTSLEATQRAASQGRAAGSAAGGDRFITFHARIKSSGYGAAPRGKPARGRGAARSAAATTTHVLDVRTYDVTTAPMRELYLAAFPAFDAASRAPVHAQSRMLSQSCWPATALTCLSMNTQGSLIAAGASDGCVWTCPAATTSDGTRVRLFAARAQRIDVSSSLPHVRNVCMSHATYAHACTDSREHVILATGAERRVTLSYAHTCPPFLVIDSVADGTRAEPFPGPVMAAALCAQDRIISCASRNMLYLFAWAPPPPVDAHARMDDIVRSRAKQSVQMGAYDCVATVTAAPEGQAVECIAAHNSARSHILCVTSNDKSLSLLDMGVSTGAVEVLRVVDAHTRPAHSIAMVAASAYADVSAPTYDAVATASYDGTVKLWDLRSAACAQTFSGEHAHRSHACGLAISPCARYVTVGSEERCGVTYDLRTGRAVERLRGASDVVMDVAYHPLAPVVMTVSLDAALRMYVPPDA